MAKKSSKPPIDPEPSGDTAMSIKMTIEFRGWLNELADHDRSTAAQVMEKGAVLYAKQVGFDKLAPKRTGGR